MTKTIKAFACLEKGSPLVPWTYTPRPLGPEDVEIKISHCGICGSDIHTLESGWGPTAYPCVVGHEIIGKITEIGSDVNHLKVGDRVGVGAQVFACLNKHGENCKECAQGNDPYCPKIVYTYNSKYEDGELAYGGYAESVRVLSHFAFKIPENIPSEYAAPLLCAGVTVFSPLKNYGAGPGVSVGIVGIGGLGHLGIQFSKALGANTVAFSHSPNKEKESISLGASQFVNVNDDKQAEAAVKSVDILLVTSNADNLPFDKYFSFLKAGGKMILVGLPNDKVTFKPFSLVSEGRSLCGSKIGSITEIKEMLRVASEMNVRPVIELFPMEKVNQGIEHMESGKVRYRVVLAN